MGEATVGQQWAAQVRLYADEQRDVVTRNLFARDGRYWEYYVCQS